MNLNGNVLRKVYGRANQKKVPMALIMFIVGAVCIFFAAKLSGLIRHSDDSMNYVVIFMLVMGVIFILLGITFLLLPTVEYTLEIRTDGIIITNSRGVNSCIPYEQLHTVSVVPIGLSYYVQIINSTGIKSLFPVESNATGIELCSAISKAKTGERT